MKHSSFCKGMAKLQAKGVSKQQAFNRMTALSQKKSWQGGSKENKNYYSRKDSNEWYNHSDDKRQWYRRYYKSDFDPNQKNNGSEYFTVKRHYRMNNKDVYLTGYEANKINYNAKDHIVQKVH